MATFDIDPVGAGAVVTNTDVHVEVLRDNTQLKDALASAITAAGEATDVVTALQGIQDNLATPAFDNILGLCESRLVAASGVINAYLTADEDMREDGRISDAAVDAANESLGWDHYGAVDLNAM